MNKVVYVGPTIIGVAAKNTVYDELPETIREEISNEPYLGELFVPISDLAGAMEQIRNQNGAIYTFYKKALQLAAKNERR